MAIVSAAVELYFKATITGKGQYNGIFLTVLKGDYDALLQWPFLCPITFTLIEQRRDAQREDGTFHMIAREHSNDDALSRAYVVANEHKEESRLHRSSHRPAQSVVRCAEIRAAQ